MANPETIDGNPAVLAASTSASSVALNPDREYTIQHLGVDVAGSEDTNSVFLGTDATTEATHAADSNKAVLQSEKALVVGPRVSTLHFLTASGAPAFQVIPGRYMP